MTHPWRAVALVAGLVVAGAVSAGDPDVARAFSKIAAQTEVGTNLRDYSALVGDANLELKMYQASAAGRAHPAAVQAFERSIVHYTLAAELWRAKLVCRNCDEVPINSDLGRSLAARNPEVLKPVSQGGAVLLPVRPNALIIDYVIPWVWRDGAAQAQEAIRQM